jgi:hypothetical protein
VTDAANVPVDEGGRIAAPHELEALAAQIDEWLEAMDGDNPVFGWVERPSPRNWIVRLHGDTKDVIALWLTLGQRSLRFESQVIPAPEEATHRVHEYLLRRNANLYGMGFAVGEEDGLYLMGNVPLSFLDRAVLDRIVGSVWQYTEDVFRPLLHMGFARRMAPALHAAGERDAPGNG